MDAGTVIAAIEGAIKIAAAAAALGKDVAPYATAIYDNLVSGKEVTQDDLDALEIEVEAVHADIQRPLPPDAA